MADDGERRSPPSSPQPIVRHVIVAWADRCAGGPTSGPGPSARPVGSRRDLVVTVYLVGAGPGDPGLLTVRGDELLRRADVVIFDRLSVASLLDLAPPGAERINVGKFPGHPT